MKALSRSLLFVAPAALALAACGPDETTVRVPGDCTGAACGETGGETGADTGIGGGGGGATDAGIGGGETDTGGGGGGETDAGGPSVDTGGTGGGTDPTAEGIRTEADLSASELQAALVLRDSVEIGLDLGRTMYVDEMNLTLQDVGAADSYDLDPAVDPHAGLDTEIVACPFLAFYDNGFEPVGQNCDYLADVAKVDAYADLTRELDDKPLPEDILASEWADEATFWYEQGVISAIEQARIMVRFDLEARGVCNETPTPVESSYTKGIDIGRQLFARAFNQELGRRGMAGTYPDVTIDICNPAQIFVEPAAETARDWIDTTPDEEPLCEGYEPTDRETSLQYAQAELDYVRGIRAGVEDELALAAVTVFQRAPDCAGGRDGGDPLVVDLDGDGVELLALHEGVNFDLFASGRATAVAWVGADDALLTMDINGDGVINDGSELFGDVEGGHAHGFAHLATLDDDGNGAIDADDAAFARLSLWQDANGNGVTDAGELTAITDAGVVRIGLDAAPASHTIAGNPVLYTGSIETVSGTLAMDDVALRFAWHPRVSVASR